MPSFKMEHEKPSPEAPTINSSSDHHYPSFNFDDRADAIGEFMQYEVGTEIPVTAVFRICAKSIREDGSGKAKDMSIEVINAYPQVGKEASEFGKEMGEEY